MQLAALPDPLCHCLHLQKHTNCVAMVRSASIGACPIPNDRLPRTRTICAEGLKYRATFFVPCFFQDSSEIHIRIIRAQQRFQLFDLHLQTLTFFQVLFRSCNNRSNDEYEFCRGVGGIILLLDSGGAFTCDLSNLISSCVTVQQRARFLEKEKECGSTKSRSEQKEETSQNSVTTEERETGTSVTSSTRDTSTRVSSSQSGRSSGFSKRCSQERSPQLSRSPPRLKISKASTETELRNLLLTLPFRSVLSPLLFSSFCPFLCLSFLPLFFMHSPVFSNNVTLFRR